MIPTADTLAGRVTLRPGHAEPLACVRPVVGAAMMRRLTEGRRAAMLPDLLGTVFTLCAPAQRATARRAVRAALGLADEPAARSREASTLALHTAREHLQRLALDLPALLPVEGVAAGAGWLRDAPVFALPVPGAAQGPGADAAAQQHASKALPAWLQRRLIGQPLQAWLDHWRADAGDWLAHWAAATEHPVAQWLSQLRRAAQACALPCRSLQVLGDVTQDMPALAAALATQDDFAARPQWQGAPAETGPWTRQGQADAVNTAWDRFGARIADLLRIACAVPGQALAFGARTVGPGEGIAWTEMSRGLLVHWVRLAPGEQDVETARVERYRVLAPTDWNFHPRGTLACAMAAGGLDARAARMATVALDPCVAFDVVEETRHA